MNCKRSIDLHKKFGGKLEIKSKIKIKTKEDLSLAYTPCVAEVCSLIAKNKKLAKKYTIKKNTVAVVTDGSAVLGLGNIGAEAAIPVMEGKAILFKELASVDAFPICLSTQDPDEIISIVKNISPVFGGINLEDISAPNCFYIEDKLQDIGIPVMHDDQHGTAIVVVAALINALKVLQKDVKKVKVVVVGAGAAGIAITKMISDELQVQDIIVCDSKGIISKNRKDLNPIKEKLLFTTNKNNLSGTMQDALVGADVFIGVSTGDILNAEMIRTMGSDSIVFAMANPIPEIMPDEAKKGGAAIVGTGRSDFPNQINNVLAFPGIFRGLLDSDATKVTSEIKINAARALADYVKNPTPENILPDPLDRGVAKVIAESITKLQN
ncbi:MAG: NADP-dependent malic enzyme [Candidatus Pacebacteria bacterium]|nr:NADP-dependent malic enzyme [Candidatus Paceibacterota bacterium]